MLTNKQLKVNSLLEDLSSRGVVAYGMSYAIVTDWDSSVDEFIDEVNYRLNVGKIIKKDNHYVFVTNNWESMFEVKTVDDMKQAILDSRFSELSKDSLDDIFKD